MSDVSLIGPIIDATAAVVAAYVPGIRAVYGVGTDAVTIPAGGVQAGQKVPVYSGDTVEPFCHVSDFPTAPTVTWYSATVTEVTWEIPFRLYLDRGDLGNLRRQAWPFYGRYLTAFSQEVKLLNVIKGGSALISGFSLFNTEEFAGIAGTIRAIERLEFDNRTTH